MRALSLLLALLSWFPYAAPERDYDALRREAEARYAEKSFGQARDLYEQASKLTLAADEKRWVAFRLADTTWRADSAAPSPDPTKREEARAALETIIRESGADHDRIWAEAQESLGDFHWIGDNPNHYGAQQYYIAALDWWAGSDDLKTARRRYLDIVFRWASPPRSRYRGESYDNYANIPRPVLVNAVEIAETREEKARARYLLARQYLDEGRPDSAERGLELLDLIIAEGKGTEWYDDALFHYAQQLSERGVIVINAEGEPERRTAYVRALELYRRLLRDFGESSRYSEAAKNAIEAITGVQVSVHVGATFLPQSEQEVVLSWRNTKSIALALYEIDLVKDAIVDNKHDWIQNVPLAGRSPARRWTYETSDRGEHVPGNEYLQITPKLGPGAYVLVASAGGLDARALVLVTDAHIVVHTAGPSLHAFVSDVVTGEPLANARVLVQQMQGNSERVTKTATTDANGLAKFEFDRGTYYSNVLVTAARGSAQQAWVFTNVYAGRRYGAGDWRIYAFTDRPAYRPDETVQWKIIARTRQDDRWATPAGTSLFYEIIDPRGQKVAEGEAKLNAYGSFWSELPVTATMPLGVYRINFRYPGSNRSSIGSAQFFRVEEYKLPEFRVSVATPPGKQYRLGDTIEATIQAEYYFGGPVANATVEAVIYQQPFYRYWTPWREYDWYFDRPQVYGHGSEMRRETLKTDAEGRAIVRIETPRDGNEMQYRIEARVVDSSRREVSGSGTVKVMRQRYTVLVQPRHYIHRPNEKVSIDFKAIDANDNPVVTTGTVKVVRRTWETRPRLGGAYRDDEITTTKLTTDKDGAATFTFTPPRDGYYLVTWSSPDAADGQPARARDVVTAETTIWVTDPSRVDIGYHASGLELIIDKEAFRAGERAPVLIALPSSGRWVVLSSAGDTLLNTQVVKLDGTVKLVYLDLDERHVPNFALTASSVFDRTYLNETKRVVVPPVEHFLDVTVAGDKPQYEPRQEGTFTITTRDVDGKPVAAEVAVAVSDESVTAIQEDLAGDPRQFFFGEQRQMQLRAAASLQTQTYLKLVPNKRGVLGDERFRPAPDEVDQSLDSFETGVAGGVEGGVPGGVVGGVVGGARADMAAPAPPPAPAPQSISVTAEAPMLIEARMTGAKVRQEAANEAVPAEPIEVTVRSDFRSTAFWKPDVITGSDGKATVKVAFPESLTTWRATARAVTATTQVGMGTSTAQTNMPLIVRLQAPRFFVAGDRAVVSAVINNNTDQPMSVTPSLEVEGLTLGGGQTSPPVNVPAHGEARADWTVIAEKAGPAKLRVTGRAATRGDAMERTFTVYEHGIDKLVARSGKLRAEEAIVRLDLPRERRATDLTIAIQPSLAGSLIDALPYLIEFPYGCTEQTMSRFLPATVVARTLKTQGLDVSKRPEFRNLDAVTKAGMARLYDFQHADGGWGWWKDGNSDLFMTAYVVWGFSLAKSAGLPVRDDAVNRAVAWLVKELPKLEGNGHDQAWVLHATSAWRKTMTEVERKALNDAWTNRERLSAYSRALLALAAHRFGDAEKARVLVRNLQDGVKIDRTPDQSVLIRGTGSTAETMATAHWGATGFWWRWWEGPVETTSFALQALLAIDPQNALVEPVMNWLAKNRRGARWHNTRDTAIAILSLNEMLARERSGAATAYEVTVNGTKVAAKSITAADILGGPTRIAVDDALIRDANEIRIRRTGDGPLYFAAEARFVSLEEPVKAAGNELFVRRDYYRLVPRPTLLKGVVYEKVPLRDGESIPSNERVEVVVTVETKNDYEYLLFEDLKPAGLEAVALQSGAALFARELRASSVLRPETSPTVVRRDPRADQTYRTTWVYQELRDRKVAMFIDKLPQGVWEIRYTLRAEVPGAFHALPLLGQAMYVPEIRANGEEVRITVTE